MRIGIVNDMRAACEALRRVVDSLPDHEVAWTAAEVIPVVEIDGRKVGTGLPGPITARLMRDFHALVRA